MAGAPATPAAFYKMITIPEAQRTVLEQARVLDSETLGLDAVLGRVLSADVIAPEALPPFPASIKVPRHQRAALAAQSLSPLSTPLYKRPRVDEASQAIAVTATRLQLNRPPPFAMDQHGFSA